MKRNIFILLLMLFVTSLLYAKEEVKLYFHNNTLSNAQTALLFLEGSHITQAKLTFEKLHIDFLPHPHKKESFFALIPISYHHKPNGYKVIVSYEHHGEKIFKGIFLTVVDAQYKSEILSVQPSKIYLSQEDKKRTQEEYADAMKVYNQTTKGLVTSFIKPLSTPITSDFGNQRLYNNTLQSFHSGTDFKAAIGTPIYSSANGVVKIAKNRFYAGNSVVIDHGYGVYSCYYHLDSLKVKEGQKIKQNELLGYSGNTGRVTGPHLHFAIRIKNIIVDPLQFIKIINILQ
ncbi:MAG: M23 family metallopeptidase [Sulfurimonadaceae bacterium]